MSRIFYDQKKNRLIVLSYAGGTKFFRPLAASLGYTPLESINNPGHPEYILQVVRDPVQRFMSWFDKQYLKDLFRKTRLKNRHFHSWCQNTVTKEFLDSYFSTAHYTIHYDGHTVFQSYWPKIHLERFNTEWRYLQMEDVNPYFLGQHTYKPKRDKKEYLGFWDTIHWDLKEYALQRTQKIYAVDIEWYNSLKFILSK